MPPPPPIMKVAGSPFPRRTLRLFAPCYQPRWLLVGAPGSALLCKEFAKTVFLVFIYGFRSHDQHHDRRTR
jgi:hypothetical protein